MKRRPFVLIAALALVSGGMLAAAGTAVAANVGDGAARHVAVRTVIRPGGPMIRPSGVTRLAGHGRNTTVQSTNWSGYAVTGGTGAFTSVSASWTQPSVTCPSKHSNQYSSFWAGLDGFNSGTVEQTGTEANCSRGTPVYFGWFEMFPAAPVNFSNPVAPGDSFSASVTFSGTDTFTLTLTDHTKNWTHTEMINQAGLARSSAEVITEAPSSNRGVLPLADFGTVTYSASAANGTSLGTQNPTQIIMVNNSGQPKDSTSAINGSGGFSNTWIRST